MEEGMMEFRVSEKGRKEKEERERKRKEESARADKEQGQQHRHRRMLPLREWGADKRIAETEWFLPPFLPLHRMNLIVSKPGVCKSMLVQDWMLASVTGQQWMGFDLPKLKWAFLDFDASEDQTRSYFDLLMEGRGLTWDDERLDNIKLITPLDDLRSFSFFDMKAESETMQFDLVKELNGCDALVIDTFADAVYGGDESAVKDVTITLKAIRHICRYCNIRTIFILHHESKQNSGGVYKSRGSSALTGKARGMVSINSITPKDSAPDQTTYYSLKREKPRGVKAKLEFVIRNYDETGDVVDQENEFAVAVGFEQVNTYMTRLNTDEKEGQEKVMAIIREASEAPGLKEMKEAFKHHGMAENAGMRWLTELREMGRVVAYNAQAQKEGRGRKRLVFKLSE